MLVAGDSNGQGPCLVTSVDQKILTGFEVLDQIFEAAAMGFGIGLVAFGIVKGWGIELNPM
jgi:hypothetical protein